MKPITKRLLIGIVVLTASLMLYALWEPYWIQTKEVTFSSKDIPAAFDGTRIIFLTDIHRGPFFSEKRVYSLVDRVNALNPDIVLLGGDYVHRSPEYIPSVFTALGHLKAPLGVYGVLGNHDHWESREHSQSEAEKAHIQLLDNKGIWLTQNGNRIRIGGVEDPFGSLPDHTFATKDVKPEDFMILLSHTPEYVEFLKDHTVDLTLSGHTHGGQITFFGLWAPLVPVANKVLYRTGIVHTPYTELIISNGIGTVTPPMRFFARPQIYIITLERMNNTISE